MSKRIKHIHSGLVLSSITLAVMSLANPAWAQQDESVQRIEVTGSSIKRLATEASLPVSTISSEEMVSRGMTTLADLMMALPQSASLAPSNAGSGTNINLRGLGVNRTLVLINGRRGTNEAIADGYANLDVIPMSAISKVEVLRDGASSIYGSDAIGGVVNFITRKSFEGATATAQMVRPQATGGGAEKRLGFTVGKGDLAVDGWNVYATMDAHNRSRLAASDRAELSSAELLTSIGRAPSLGTGGYAMPANFTTATNKTAANPYGTSCSAPYSILGQKGTCILNTLNYNTALYGNEQISFYTKGTKRISDDHTITLDYTRGQEFIERVANPVTSLGLNSVLGSLPSTSKWYPGASGGVPAVAGLKGEPLLVTWSIADLGLQTTKDVQVLQRTTLVDEGRMAGWDYKLGATYAISDRKSDTAAGTVEAAKIQAGLTSGALNPFGLQDAAGLAYLKSISFDGNNIRTSKSTFAGVDVTINRELMALGGGQLAVAIGADYHRDTTIDTKTPAGYLYNYTLSVEGKGERNVAALFAELDAPITKELNLNFAVRDDNFSDFGNTINPKASFRYQPSKLVMFRGSANTGFRAPTLFDAYGYRVAGANATTSAKWDDPVLCPGGTPGVAGTGKAIAGQVSATVCNATMPKQTGANPDLTPETSQGATLGLVFEPNKNLTVSVDYWRITMDNMIANLPEQSYFLNPAKYSSLFVRNADGSLNYIKNIVMNLGGQKAAGIDLSVTYDLPKTWAGDFKIQLDGTYLTQFDNQLEKDAPFTSNIGQFGLASNGTTSSFPIITYRWKHTLAFSWANGPFSAQLTQNHNAGYHDQNLVAAQYFRDIESYNVWNLSTNYRGIKHVTIAAGITNLFNVNPPVTNSSLYSNGYLSSAASPIGRSFNTRVTYAY